MGHKSGLDPKWRRITHDDHVYVCDPPSHPIVAVVLNYIALHVVTHIYIYIYITCIHAGDHTKGGRQPLGGGCGRLGQANNYMHMYVYISIYLYIHT